MVNVLRLLSIVVNHLFIKHNIMESFEGTFRPKATFLQIPVARVNSKFRGQCGCPFLFVSIRSVEYITYWIPEMNLPSIGIAFVVGYSGFGFPQKLEEILAALPRLIIARCFIHQIKIEASAWKDVLIVNSRHIPPFNPTFHVREQNPSGCWGFALRSSLHSRFGRVGSFA